MIVNRIQLRGEKLHDFCCKAKTFRHKTLNDTIIIFCYGVSDKKECKKCKAYLGVIK